MGISSSHNRRSLKVMGHRRGTSNIPLKRATTNMRRRSLTRISSSTKRLNLVSRRVCIDSVQSPRSLFGGSLTCACRRQLCIHPTYAHARRSSIITTEHCQQSGSVYQPRLHARPDPVPQPQSAATGSIPSSGGVFGTRCVRRVRHDEYSPTDG
jgi:hypothetical protein